MKQLFHDIPEPPGIIRVVELRHGARIDVIGVHDASGECRQLEPVHWATLEQARGHAELIAKCTGCRIEEHLR